MRTIGDMDHLAGKAWSSDSTVSPPGTLDDVTEDIHIQQGLATALGLEHVIMHSVISHGIYRGAGNTMGWTYDDKTTYLL